MGGRGGGSSVRSPIVVAQQTIADINALADRDVRDAYDDVLNITGLKGPWVDLVRLRTALATRGMDRGRQDSVLRRMALERKIRLIPEENQKTISDRDRAAAINLSGEDKHIIGFKDRL